MVSETLSLVCCFIFTLKAILECYMKSSNHHLSLCVNLKEMLYCVYGSSNMGQIMRGKSGMNENTTDRLKQIVEIEVLRE